MAEKCLKEEHKYDPIEAVVDPDWKPPVGGRKHSNAIVVRERSHSDSRNPKAAHTRARMPSKAYEVLFGSMRRQKRLGGKQLDKLGVSAKQLKQYQSNPVAHRKLGTLLPAKTSLTSSRQTSNKPKAYKEPHKEELTEEDLFSADRVRASSKAQDLLFGSRKKLKKKNKLFDLLGVNESEFQMFQSNPTAFRKLGLLYHVQPSSSARQTHEELKMEEEERALSVELPSRVRGVTEMEMSMFRSNPEAFQKMGELVQTSTGVVGMEDVMDALRERESASAPLPEEMEEEKKPVPVPDKAHDLLFGGRRREGKVYDKLGMSKSELDLFRKTPKAFKLLGVADTAPAPLKPAKGRTVRNREARRSLPTLTSATKDPVLMPPRMSVIMNTRRA